MQTKIIETAGNGNWGKFMLGRLEPHEWLRESALPERYGNQGERFLLSRWTQRHLWVMDLETGEGAFFYAVPSGVPEADLCKRAIWVCPMFPAFLAWLYAQDLTDLQALPDYVDLPAAPFALSRPRAPWR